MAPAAVGFAFASLPSRSVMGPIIAFLFQHPNKRKRERGLKSQNSSVAHLVASSDDAAVDPRVRRRVEGDFLSE